MSGRTEPSRPRWRVFKVAMHSLSDREDPTMSLLRREHTNGRIAHSLTRHTFRSGHLPHSYLLRGLCVALEENTTETWIIPSCHLSISPRRVKNPHSRTTFIIYFKKFQDGTLETQEHDYPRLDRTWSEGAEHTKQQNGILLKPTLRLWLRRLILRKTLSGYA